jgi:hypothetical protein
MEFFDRRIAAQQLGDGVELDLHGLHGLLQLFGAVVPTGARVVVMAIDVSPSRDADDYLSVAKTPSRAPRWPV